MRCSNAMTSHIGRRQNQTRIDAPILAYAITVEPLLTNTSIIWTFHLIPKYQNSYNSFINNADTSITRIIWSVPLVSVGLKLDRIVQ